MNLDKIYYTAEGEKCNILKLVKLEPEWAANQIQEGEKAIKKIEIYKQYLECLNKSNSGAFIMAHIHGWKCPQEDIDKGIEFRRLLEEE